MGLFDLIDFAAEKAYSKYKESKLENAMDAILNSLDAIAINIEMLPYNEGEDIHKIKGKVYRLGKENVLKTSATYFLTTSDWLLKSGISLKDDKTYEAALHEKAGYLYQNLVNAYSDTYKNYKAKYGSNLAFNSLLLYIPEEKLMLSIPKFIKDKKTGKILLSKRAAYDEFNKVEKIKLDNPEKYESFFSSFYSKAKMFSYKVAEELKSYDKNDLGNAVKKFSEMHASDSEIEYTF